MKHPTTDRLPEDFDELDAALPLPRRAWVAAACLAGAAIITGALVAIVDALT